MPTHPSSQPAPHQHRGMAESFGVDPERYDRTRPRYPTALVEWIVAASPGREVLDVGCGTGIAARAFQAGGCTVHGVEPDARMAGFARERGVAVEEGRFEEWAPRERRFDAVVAGQTWHWVDPAAGAAKAAEVLRPGGLLVPFWNAFHLPPELARATAQVLRRVLPDAPFDPAAVTQSSRSAYDTFVTHAAEAARATGEFGAPREWRLEWEQHYTRDEWLEQLPTQGAFTRLPPDKLAEVLDAVGAALDAVGGEVTLGYTTVALALPRNGSE